MIDLNLIREDGETIVKDAKRRGIDVDLKRILELDKQSRKLNQSIEELAAKKNAMSGTIAQADAEEKASLISDMQKLSDEEKGLKAEHEPLVTELQSLLLKIPNLLHDDVPDGASEEDNVVVRTEGEVPTFMFKPKDQIELGESLDCIDTKLAAEVSGARFTYLKNGAAELQLAIMNLVVDTLTNESKLAQIASEAGLDVSTKPFQFVIPPVMIRPEIYRKMGRLTDEVQDERYYLQQDDLYLIGSAEHTLGPMLMNKTVKSEDLPIRFLGYSTSFRREAGSYGKDTQGIIRTHQFDKLEMESFTEAGASKDEQDFIVAIQEHLLKQLELSYQVVMICTGDIGKMDARQIDLETWIPSQDKYRETHTSDLMTDFQARRLNAKYKDSEGKKHYLHMNDATAFAMGRIIVALLENHQQEDGSVHIPVALQPYMRGQKTIAPRA